MLHYPPVPLKADILDFAYQLGFTNLYDWQARILLRYQTGEPVAAACANFTGKTSTIFPIASLWTLFCFPTARVMYLSATGAQVKNQFFAALKRFADHPYFSSWTWLDQEVKTADGGFMFGRSTDTGGNIEGIHNQFESPASLLIDEAKSIRDEVMDALSRCNTTFRLFMSSTGAASGSFYQMCTARAHLVKTFRVTSDMCPHVPRTLIEDDRQNLKDSVFRIKHSCEWLYDAGDSMISLEHVRHLIDNPPAAVPGLVTAFCDFAGAGDESVLALCEGNSAHVVDAWRHRDTMHSVGKFLVLFRKLRLKGYQIGGDEGYGHQLMDRMAEEDFYLRRISNGSPARKPELYVNLSAEWWSVVGQLIEHRKILIPNDEKLIAQLTSRQKLYDSKGREKLEAKDDLKARGVESPDRADALIGAVMLGIGSDPYAINSKGSTSLHQELDKCALAMRTRNRFIHF